MRDGLPIWIMEPEPTPRKTLLARVLAEGGQRAAQAMETAGVDAVKQRLTKIREYALENLTSLAEELKANLELKYPGVRIKSAVDDAAAVQYITHISEGVNIIATNNSSTVQHELKPLLLGSGFTVMNSYLDEFDVKGEEGLSHWELPSLLDRGLMGSFEVSERMSGIDQPDISGIETRDYLAVLGVNAMSAEDGTAFLLQHYSNISKDLRQAKKVILVVGIDRLVKTTEDAAFQTQCMGVFGMESILLDMGRNDQKTEPSQPRIPDIQGVPVTTQASSFRATERSEATEGSRGISCRGHLAMASGDSSTRYRSLGMTDHRGLGSYEVPTATDSRRELHVVLLDNGRTHCAQGSYRELLRCIGCRACAKQCPGYRYLEEFYCYPRQYLWSYLIGNNPSTESCSYCGLCHFECPVSINLPLLIASAKAAYSPESARSISSIVLTSVPRMAPLGSLLAPLVNRLADSALLRVLMEKLTGVDRRRKFPPFHFRTLERQLRSRHE